MEDWELFLRKAIFTDFLRDQHRDAEEKMSELADMIPSLDGQQGTLYLDAFDPNAAGHGYVMVTDGGALNPAWAKDAVHPNLEGYHKMEEILLKSVKFK